MKNENSLKGNTDISHKTAKTSQLLKLQDKT